MSKYMYKKKRLLTSSKKVMNSTEQKITVQLKPGLLPKLQKPTRLWLFYPGICNRNSILSSGFNENKLNAKYFLEVIKGHYII